MYVPKCETFSVLMFFKLINEDLIKLLAWYNNYFAISLICYEN